MSIDPGFDTADTVQDAVSSGALTEHGTPGFWLRYFHPCPNESLAQDPVTECRAIWDSGASHLSPICDPPSSNESMTGSAGQEQGKDDAQTFVGELVSTYNAVGPLLLPTNQYLLCWLDLESGKTLSSDYWNGWAGYVNAYYWPGAGYTNYPLSACLYCNPGNGNGCKVIDNLNNQGCQYVWASEHETCCCPKLSSPPSWDAEKCSNVPTGLWQWAEQQVCGYYSKVDLDLGSINTVAYCFYLSGRP